MSKVKKGLSPNTIGLVSPSSSSSAANRVMKFSNLSCSSFSISPKLPSRNALYLRENGLILGVIFELKRKWTTRLSLDSIYLTLSLA